MQPAQLVTQFRESVIRDMTRLALKHDAINLSQGFPDFGTPEPIKQAAIQAIQDGWNQYAVTWGIPPLRQKLAEMYTDRLGWEVRADEHITVTCGVSEGIVIAVGSVLNPGEELIVLEPAHDNFRPAAHMAGGKPVPVPLEAPDYRIEADLLQTAVSAKTRAILLNTPHNPSGRVFDADELQTVIDFVLKHDLILITDEIYDRILYDGRIHKSPGSYEALRDRTITIGGLGKTFAITGWRLGYVIAPHPLARGVRSLHDYTTICAPTPLQMAAVAALNLPESYFAQSTAAYHQRRDVMMNILQQTGFQANKPQGAYYVLADYSQLDVPQAKLNPTEFAEWMTAVVGVAVVPSDSFYSVPGYGTTSVRFAYPKKLDTLEEAGARMQAKLC
jgi:aspartate/methionine/tyrosine aminotransferase